jgi:hypothetical protein
MISEIASNTGLPQNKVVEVIEVFARVLHRRIYEYRGLNGDFIGEALLWETSSQAYFHLLGVLKLLAERYEWESGTASEYLLRLGRAEDWEPYRCQMEGWNPQSK